MATRVLSVGQCGFDHGNISRLLRNFDAEVVPVDTAAEALTLLQNETYNLVLVNRVFDLGGDGMEFIREAKATRAGQETPVMLVSNYADWQEKAVAAGAVRGFGKAALTAAATFATLRPILGSEAPSDVPP